MARKTIEVDWDNDEHTIIREMFIGRWTWNEFYEVARDVPPMMTATPHTVHILADFRQSGPLPIGPAIIHARNTVQHLPDNWGIMVIVTPSMFIRTMVDVFRRMFPGRVAEKTFAVRELEEAYALMEQYGAAQTAS
ncbi:MAG: STAS/SEC14 domain-containing protein [Burkholderiales bacterium]|nr:STAS/SEC14 domain-containing protein [Anaerolineae bacterium]